MALKNKRVLVTGSGGFIGMHLCVRLLSEGYKVVGLDNLNAYPSGNLRHLRLAELGANVSSLRYNKIQQFPSGMLFIQLDITDRDALMRLFKTEKIDVIVNLAAQTGVRYSMQNPQLYIDSNIKGFQNVLDCAHRFRIEHFIYASSSSVYGLNKKLPFNESDKTEQQTSLYASTKKANETMAHSYASNYGPRYTGLRFFTVYGPFGRTDMAVYRFIQNILNNDPIDVFNHGNQVRDFTFVDDIIQGIVTVIDVPSVTSNPHQIYNLGRGKEIALMELINTIEEVTGKTAICNMLPAQPGDMDRTWADMSLFKNQFGFEPKYSLKDGITKAIDWFERFQKGTTTGA